MSKEVQKTVPLTEQIPDSRIRQCITKCLQSMEAWGMKVNTEIRWSMKKMDSFGRTTSVSGETFIRIILNQGLVTQSRKVVEDTIYHELAHALVGIKCGHGAEWKRTVKEIRKHTNLPLRVNGKISDVTNDFWLTGYKYVLKCTKCGQMIGFNAKNDLVNNPNEWDVKHNCQRFTHKDCGGSWERVK